MRARVVTIIVGGLVVLLTALPSATTAAPLALAHSRQLPRVTLISDSVGASIAFDVGAKAILSQGVDLFLEPGEGRRLGGSTPAGAIAPPTALQLITTLGRRLGPTVIMCVGYNDVSDQYAANIETALGELQAAGVKHVLWATLRVSPDHLGNATMNNAIVAAAAHHPELTVVDWNAYAAGHPEWFQPDGVHLLGDGPRALARLFHASLVRLGVPLSPGR